jgi:hypothetical protein
MTTKPPKESTTQSLDDPHAAHLRAALLALPAEVVEGGACKIVKRDGKTFGYVAFEARPPCIYVSDGHGKLVQIRVASVNDVSKAMTALMSVDAARSQDCEGRE